MPRELKLSSLPSDSPEAPPFSEKRAQVCLSAGSGFENRIMELNLLLSGVNVLCSSLGPGVRMCDDPNVMPTTTYDRLAPVSSCVFKQWLIKPDITPGTTP